MADDLDDILNSALDEVDEDEVDSSSANLQAAVKAAADESAATAKQAETEAAKATVASAAGGLGGGLESLGGLLGGDFDENAAQDLLKQLDDPEFAKTLEETLKFMESGDMSNLQAPEGGEADAEVANTLKALAEAAKGLEGADASQTEEMGEKIMQDMMKQFENLGGKEDFNSIMEGMLKQLLSKDILYEPFKQVCEKYPEWLAENESKLDKAEYERYGKQYQYYQKIVEVYETEPDNFSRTTELLQEVQEYGQPPVEIMKELAPGLEIGEDGVPKMPGLGGVPGAGGAAGGLPPGMPPMEGCAQQ